MERADYFPNAVSIYSSSKLRRIIETTTDEDVRIACRRELLQRQGTERDWQYSAIGEHPMKTLHKKHSLHAVQKF